VLPALLFEGRLVEGENAVGKMVRERWGVVAEINQASSICTPFSERKLRENRRSVLCWNLSMNSWRHQHLSNR
jgi:hypothetical protein